MTLQKVKAANGKLYEVSWDESRRDVYVKQVGGFFTDGSTRAIGKASNAREAAAQAEAWAVAKTD